MGWLSTIGKLGAGLAAPFTGGASLAAIPAIGAIGQVAGGAAGGMASGRQGENANINSANRNTIDLYGTQQNAKTQQYQTLQNALMQLLQAEESSKQNRAGIDLQRRNFALNAPSARGKQALLGSLIQNIQDVNISGGSPQMRARMPQISGGLRPSAIGPMAQQMGALMQQNAVSGQQKGDVFDPMAPTDFKSGLVDPQTYTIDAPELQALQESGLLEKILGGIGLGGSLFGALGQGGGQNDFGKFDFTTPTFGRG